MKESKNKKYIMCDKVATKGITLIALVITIILLLILAAVSINLAVDSDGIINKASAAKEKNRAALVKEAIEFALIENRLGGTPVSKSDFIEQLVNEGKLTQEEAKELEDSNEITIGGITIDFEKIDNTFIGKYVYYKGLKFEIMLEEENILLLKPLKFSPTYNYLLSAHYIEQDGKKVSVPSTTVGAKLDANYEEFSARIKEELDTACQNTFGTSDGKITAANSNANISYKLLECSSEDSFNDITDFNELTYEQYIAVLDEEIRRCKEKYDVTDEMMANVKKQNNSTYLFAALISGIVPEIEEGYSVDFSILSADLAKNNQGELTDEYINSIEDSNYKKLLTSGMKLTDIFVFDALQTYWTTETVEESYENDGRWKVKSYNGADVFHDTIDDVILMSYNNYSGSMDYTYNSKELPLAPILIVDSSLLKTQLGSSNTYEINY